jgi:hypothetical protein
MPPTVVSRPTMPLNNIFLSCFLNPPWSLPQKISYVTFASKGIYMEKYLKNKTQTLWDKVGDLEDIRWF